MSRTILSEDIKNKILKLVDLDFVRPVLLERLPQHYPNFKEISDLKFYTHKNHIGRTSVVFVVEYALKYKNKRGEDRRLNIFASAHSDGSRWGAYQKNLALYRSGFSEGPYRVTRPLFFLEEQQAFFYQSSPGKSLRRWFIKDAQADLRPVLALSAGWIKKLHSLDHKPGTVDWPIFKITDMVPQPSDFIADFLADNIDRGKLVQQIVDELQTNESSFAEQVKPSLVYGDYHPENIVIRDLSTDHIEMIDFTDVAWGDPLIDVGAFLEQFDFMMHRYLPREKINDYETFFVEAYFGKNFADIDQVLINRINLYQAWTALRIAVFLFYAHSAHIDDMLEEIKAYLQAISENKHIINLY